MTKDAPITSIHHGDNQEVAPLQQSKLLVAELKEAGVEGVLVVHKYGGYPRPISGARTDRNG